MKLDDTDGELRDFADRLFDLVENVGGSRPELLENGYYKGHHQGNGFVYLRLVGDAARKYHRGSVHLHTGWDDRLAGELVQREKNWHGGTPSADLNARPADPHEVALAEGFIRAAFRVHGVAASGGLPAEKTPRNAAWQRDELILALALYVRYSGNPPSHAHPDIVELSHLLNALPIHSSKGDSKTFRNENGVYLKLMNFRRFDKSQPGVGMTRGNKLEEEVWDEYAGNPALLEKIAARIREGYTAVPEATTTEPEEETFPEGRVLFRLHRLRERNPAVIGKAKAAERKRSGCLACCVCGFDFATTYGALGVDFIEGHHTKPLADLDDVTETKVADIALVCSNCHRMLHRRRPWLGVNQLRLLLAANAKPVPSGPEAG